MSGHLQVATECGAASATPTAALSGSNPKAPGSAGGYLPSHDHAYIADRRLDGVCANLRLQQAFVGLTMAVGLSWRW